MCASWNSNVLIDVKKGNAKQWSKLLHSALISHASKVMLKILQPGFSNTWTMNFQMFNLVLEKAEKSEIKLPASAGSWKKQENATKNVYFCFIDYAKAFVWITINCGKFWKKWACQTTPPASWETYMQVRKQQLELDMEQQTGSR